MNDEPIIHRSPFADWFATQDISRGVWLCDKSSDRKVKVEPPLEWGRDWSWNITEDGNGVYFKRKRKPFAPDARVIRRQFGTPGTIVERLGPGTWVVMTDEGLEIWTDEDTQPAEED